MNLLSAFRRAGVPAGPFDAALRAPAPSRPSDPPARGPAPLLEAEAIRVQYPAARRMGRRAGGPVRAVDGVSLSVGARETLGLVGESGCGKSSLGRALLLLPPPDGGRILFGGLPVTGAPPARIREFRRRAQMVFQNPYASLTPRRRILDLLTEPLAVHGLLEGRREDAAARQLEEVGLPADTMRRFPAELSGGQRQRIGLARALSLSPELLVCDEAVSALDVSVQAQVLNLLMDLRERRGLAFLFISHDLAVVRHLAHRVAVMYLGRLVESGPAGEVLSAPRHPYTRALLDSVPGGDPGAVPRGDPPSPSDPPPGCAFHPRCPVARPECRERAPGERSDGVRTIRCFHPLTEGPGG